MTYLWLKLLHIISATILFGTGIGTACTLVWAHRTGKTATIATATRYVVFADWIFTTTSGLLQPLTGLGMVYFSSYPFSSFWIIGGLVGYVIAAACWFPVVFLQIRMRRLAAQAVQENTALPPLYFRYFRYWFCLGWPAFFSLLIVFYFMTFKPTF